MAGFNMQTGFIGLGAMGAPMARNLHRAGLLASVWNRSTPAAVALAAELGIAQAASPADLAGRCDAIVICVSADQDVLDIYASYHRELFVGRKPAVIAIELYKKAYLGGNRPVTEVNKLFDGSCGENAWKALPHERVIDRQ